MNYIQKIINAHTSKVYTTLAQILTDLIEFNRMIERSLSNASYLVEDDHLSELFMDLAWEKNLLSRQLKIELVDLEDIRPDMVDLERQSFDFNEFEEYAINSNAPDREFLINAVLKTETLLSNYTNVIEVNNLPVSTVILLKSQRDDLKQGQCLMQKHYIKEAV